MIVQVERVLTETYGLTTEQHDTTGELVSTSEKQEGQPRQNLYWLQVRIPLTKEEHNAIVREQERLRRAKALTGQ